MMEIQEDEFSKLYDTILETSSSYFQANNRPILLSELGTKLGPIFSKEKHGSLKEIIKEKLAGKLVVLSDQKHPTRIFVGAIDKRQKIDIYITNTSPSYSNQNPESIPSNETQDSSSINNQEFDPTKIQKSVLIAFQKPINTNKRRYITTDKPFRYGEDSIKDEEREDVIYINEKYINSSLPRIRCAPEEDPNVIDNFKKWLKKQNLEATKFYLERNKTTFNEKPLPANLLLSLVNAQPAEIRSRMLIPAEVILKLLQP